MNFIKIILLITPFLWTYPAWSKLEKATVAGGCFWCMEEPFEKQKGVKSVISGFMGGDEISPTYKQVSSGQTAHLEVVQITFDSQQISYNDLLEIFWRNVDPTDPDGQFVDRGPQYATAIFYHNDDQKKQALESKKKMEDSKRFKKTIVTPIRPAKVFSSAEEYHQDFYKNSEKKYKYYRYRSGRDEYINKVWGKEKDYKPKVIERNQL